MTISVGLRRIARAAIVLLLTGVAVPLLTTAALAADDGAAAFAADRALLAALARSDAAATAALLDADFAWTDIDGRTRAKTEALRELAALAAMQAGDTDVRTHFYGELATVRGIHNKARFVRMWVKRPAGWRAFVFLDTPIPDQPPAQASIEAAAGAGDCDNPCRTVPYQPATPMDKTILAVWQETKMEEWRPHPHWPTHIADEFEIVNNTTFRTKEQRVAIAKKQVEAGYGAPGDPILSMRIHDIGSNSAVMISNHFPYRGGKPYYNVRGGVLRDDRWQLALSQQSTIQSAAPLPAVAVKQ
jgi:hypothetical protein